MQQMFGQVSGVELLGGEQSEAAVALLRSGQVRLVRMAIASVSGRLAEQGPRYR